MGTSLNPTLGRWLGDAPAPAVDCAACARFGKCCDFQPFVPNWALGQALADGLPLPPPSPKYALLPLGLVPAAGFRRARALRGDAPATDDAELCAFYQGGRCAIWAYRPGECGAYHCTGENPDLAARAFAFETTLAQMALVEQGFTSGEVARQIDILNEPGDGLGGTGDVERIYRRAWDWARDLSRADIDAWLEDT